jgi:hypothetical protein
MRPASPEPASGWSTPEVTVSKHAASGSSSHPLVAAALAQRTGEGGAHREGRAAEKSPVGWPGPTPSPDGGIGWPADAGDSGQADEEPAPPKVQQPPAA